MIKTRKEKGMAMVVVVGFIVVMSLVGLYMVHNTMSESQQLKFTNDSQKAQYLAEAALEKAILRIKSEMNSYPADSLKKLGHIGTNPWFWFFRLPGLFAEGGLTKGIGFNQGFNVSLNLQLANNLLAKQIFDEHDLGLESLVVALSGNRGYAEVKVDASIDDAFGITPDKPMFEIPGISIPDVPIASKVIDFLKDGKLPDIELPIPEFNFKDIKISVSIYGIPIDIPVGKFLPESMKIDIKGLLENAGVPTKISLGNIAMDAIGNILPKEIITPDIDKTVGGITIEKIGNVKFVVEARYVPFKGLKDHPQAGFNHKIIATKEFKVADISGPSPLYTFYVENTQDKKINLNGGDGHLYLNNVSFGKLGIGKEGNPLKMAEVINFPGLVRINGTKSTNVKLNFIGPLKGWDCLAATEWTHIFLPGKSDDFDDGFIGPSQEFSMTTGFIPKIPTLLYGLGQWGCWQWPSFGTSNSVYTIPWPDSDAKTHLFGEFGLKPTWSREVEGMVKKDWRKWYACIIDIVTPWFELKLPFWYTLWQNSRDDELSRYGIRWKGGGLFKPMHEYSKIEEKVKPSDDNRASNIYEITQYGKKASYFYNSSDEFVADVEKRSMQSHDGYFNLDGVNFINSSVELPEMRVKGIGMIVSAGDIIVKGNLYQKGGVGDGVYSTTMGTKAYLVAPLGTVRFDGGYQVDAGVYAKKGLQSSGGSSIINGNFACDEFDKKHINGDIRINYMASKTKPDLLSLIPYVGKYAPRRYYTSLSDQFSSYRYERSGE